MTTSCPGLHARQTLRSDPGSDAHGVACIDGIGVWRATQLAALVDPVDSMARCRMDGRHCRWFIGASDSTMGHDRESTPDTSEQRHAF